MADLAFPAATIITMISTIDRDPRGGAAQARLEIGPGPAPGSRRRVCVVSETYPPEINGVAMTLARLVDGLRGRGHAVSVVRPRQRVDRCGPPRDAEEFLVHGAPLPGYGGLQIGLPAAGALRRHWTRHRPDVVYVATEGPLGWSAVRAATRLRLPVVSGFHTNFHSYAKHYHAGWIVRVVVGYLRRFHNRTTATVVATADLRARLNALGFTNLSVLGRGVDSALFTPERRCTALRAAWGASEHDIVALYVGRIAPEKNLELAVEAYRGMQRVGGARRFVLVGDGPQWAALQKPSRPCLPRGPHRTAARRALCHGRRLSLPERDRDVRERGPGSDGERSRPRRLRLRRGAHARDARGNRRAHPVWTGGRLRRGRGRAGPVAAASRPDPPTGPRVSGQRGLAASDRAFRSNSLGCSRTEEVTIVMNEGLRLEWLVAGLLVGSIVAALVARRAVTAFWTLRAMALTPTLSRRLSRWVKPRSYSEEEFFRADGAAEPWVERRQQGLARLASFLRARYPRCADWGDALRTSFSDLRFTDANRVPFPFARFMRDHFNQCGGDGVRRASLARSRRPLDPRRRRIVRSQRRRLCPL